MRGPAVGLIMLALTASCSAEWRTIMPEHVARYGQRDQMEVWQHGESMRWHAVVVDSTNVSGIPFYQPPDCDSCRITVARSSVDSIRVGHPMNGFWESILLIGTSLGIYTLLKQALAS